MRARGIESLELWCIAPHLDLTRLDVMQQTEKLKDILRKYSLAVRCVTPEQVVYPVNIASSDRGLRESSVEYFKRAAWVADALGADHLFLTSGTGLEDEPMADARRHSLESLARIIEEAKRYGVNCLLEPLQREESNLVNSLEGVRDYITAIGEPSLGVTLDTVALATGGDSVRNYLDVIGARIRHIQVVDGTPGGHLAWGDGNLPLPEYMDEIASSDVQGSITFEPFGDGRYGLDPVRVWDKGLPELRLWFR